MRKWYILSIAIMLLAAGCKSDAPLSDPFAGRTTIPPPATGSVSGKADPYYQQPPSLTPGTPQTPAGATVAAPTGQTPGQPLTQPSLPVSQPLTVPQPTQGSAQPIAAPVRANPAPVGTQQPPTGGASLAPRPVSTMPGGGAAPRSSTQTAPAVHGTTTYTPPSSYQSPYQGATSQVPVSAVSAPSSSATSYNNGTAASRPGVVSNDRLPGPVDDTATSATAGRKPIVRTISPRGAEEPSGRPVDIEDLPNAR